MSRPPNALSTVAISHPFALAPRIKTLFGLQGGERGEGGREVSLNEEAAFLPEDAKGRRYTNHVSRFRVEG